MNRSKIEWCDHTWNPITGCLHNCEYCYARKITTRFSGDVRLNKMCTASYTTQVGDYKGQKLYVLDAPMANETGYTLAYPFGFEPTFHRYRLDKAKSIMKNCDGESITGLSFLIDTGVQQIPVRLPVKVDECLKVLKKEKRENPRKQIKDTREQAERVAWRILKDWVEAQMALLDIEMVRFEEIFLPYIETGTGQTIYERLKDKQFLLEG